MDGGRGQSTTGLECQEEVWASPRGNRGTGALLGLTVRFSSFWDRTCQVLSAERRFVVCSPGAFGGRALVSVCEGAFPKDLSLLSSAVSV